MASNAFNKIGFSASKLSKEMGFSRTTAHRIATGSRFIKIRSLFFDLFIKTGLTPNDILNIPPSQNHSAKHESSNDKAAGDFS